MADTVDNARRGLLKALPGLMLAGAVPAVAAMASTSAIPALYAEWRETIAAVGREVNDDRASDLCQKQADLEREAAMAMPQTAQDVAMLFMMATFDLEEEIRPDDAVNILASLKALVGEAA